MPITATGKTSGSSTALTSTKTTASVTLPASTLILLAVSTQINTGGPVTVSSVTSSGATWVSVSTGTYSSSAHINDHHLEVWRTMVSPNQTGVITMNLSNVSNRVCWSVISFANVKTTGLSGEDAVLQPTSAVLVFPGPPSVTEVDLAAFDSADNATYGAVDVDVSTAIQGSGFTEIHDVLNSTGGTRSYVETEFKNSNDTTVNWLTNGSGQGIGIAMEIVFDSGTNTAQALAATSTFTAAMSRGYGKIFAVDTNMSPSIGKGIGKVLGAVSTFGQGMSLSSEQIPGQTDVGLAASSVFTPTMDAEKRGIHGNYEGSIRLKTNYRGRTRAG